jgi:GT2 family glycosyltransferase/peptidoglycan/xylan/chitin deacetylase (PgdA/CDA1 family)
LKISVVIATFNRKDVLADCLRTLSDQDLPRAEFEIIVVIDGANDGTIEMLKSQRTHARLVFFEQTNRGQAAARNVGVTRSSGDLILLLDDDMQCEPNLLSVHCEAHKGTESAVVSGEICSILSARPGLAEQSSHEDLSSYYARLKERGHPVWPDNACVGPNCSIPRKVFLENGGFDEMSFPRRWEDVELGMRIWKCGIPFRYAPSAIVTHRYLKSQQQWWTDMEEDGASIVRLCRKHPEMRARSAIFSALTAAPLKRLATRILSGRWFLRILVLGALVRVFEKIGAGSNARQLCRRLFGFQNLLVLIAGARREAGSWCQLTRLYRISLPVLLYHHVGDPNELMKEHALSVSRAKFRRQIRWLRLRGYQPITSAQWLAWCTNCVLLPMKAVLLTFDDGYSDLVYNAFPVLENHRFPALVFVITRQTELGEHWEGSRLLTFEEIRQWAARGIEFGGHTRTHADLAAISAELANEEVGGCGSDLARENVETVSFAYPYGSVNEQARRSVEGVFSQAFTCEEGLNDLKTDPLLLKRTMVHPGDTLLDLEFRLRFGRSPLDSWRSKLRIRSRLVGFFRKVVLRT